MKNIDFHYCKWYSLSPLRFHICDSPLREYSDGLCHCESSCNYFDYEQEIQK